MCNCGKNKNVKRSTWSKNTQNSVNKLKAAIKKTKGK